MYRWRLRSTGSVHQCASGFRPPRQPPPLSAVAPHVPLHPRTPLGLVVPAACQYPGEVDGGPQARSGGRCRRRRSYRTGRRPLAHWLDFLAQRSASLSVRPSCDTSTRDGDGWLADVPALPGTHTWAKTLRSLDRNVREVIGMVEDLPRSAEAALDLEMDYHTGDLVLDERAAGCARAAASRNAPPLKSPATPPSSSGASPRSFRSAMRRCC